MRVLVAGASGVAGRQLLPRLVGRGHEVFGTTRTPEGARLVEELGATPLVATHSMRTRWPGSWRTPSPR